MQRPLPEFIDPLRLSGKGRVLSGSFAISRLSRIQELLLDEDVADPENGIESGVSVELAFGVDVNDQAYMTGTIAVVMRTLCQRCMKAMRWQQDIPVSLAFVSSESEAEKIASVYEPYLLCAALSDTLADEDIARDKVHSLIDIIESEIILALPQEAKHNDDECEISDRYLMHEDDNDARKLGVSDVANKNSTLSKPKSKPNPFAVLKQLKDK